jgi:hypothetical protein
VPLHWQVSKALGLYRVVIDAESDISASISAIRRFCSVCFCADGQQIYSNRNSQVGQNRLILKSEKDCPAKQGIYATKLL